MRPDRIHDAFPAPSYREHQREALDRIAAAFDDGARAVLVCAPTGSGKSLLARAICGCARQPSEASETEPFGAYYTSPQVAQLDAVAADPLLSDIAVIRGKRNYECILPDERDTPVDRAPCARVDGFDCDRVHRCPYFSDREIARNRQIAGMTLAYFMHTAGAGVFDRRDVVVIDEAHGLAEWAELYATIELSARTVPFWGELSVPTVGDDRRAAVTFADRVLVRCEREYETLVEADELTPAEAATRDRLRERITELEWFISACEDPDHARQWVVDQSTEDGEPSAVRFKPLRPGRFLRRTVWDRGERFALLSATILDADGFCQRIGLDPSEVRRVEIPHTFPLNHRPLYDVTAGKMTASARAETFPALARTVARVMGTHPDEKGIVHCHSYAIQAELRDRLAELGVGERVCSHSRGDREAPLERWQARDDAAVFLSVKMEEALDLEGDLARWQVLCKAPFPNAGDASVAARLERGAWDWYYRTTLRTIIQACGRVVRSPDDHGATYVADSSILEVFERTGHAMPGWFREQVDAMSRPELASIERDPGSDTGTAPDVAADSATERSEPPNGPRSGSHPLGDVWHD